ncbi:MAG: class I SAM-dependent methyltransferase [Candidatus Acidiferrales bacterium]
MSLRTEYDVWHSKYHGLDPSYDDTSSPWYAWAREEIGEVRGLRTLEVACGRGGFVRALARNGARACGLDFSLAALRIGKQRSLQSSSESGAAFIQGDAHALPFPDNCFDILVSCETIEHLSSPEQGVREFHRVTRPGGTLLLTTPNYLNLMGLYEVYAKFRHPIRVSDQPFDRIQFFFQTRRLLKQAGWRILRSDGFVHQLPLFPARNPVRVKSIDTSPMLRKALRSFAYTYCLVAKKRESAPAIL